MSDWDQLRGDGEELGMREAPVAILTDDGKADGEGDLEEFFAAGDAEIATVMACLADVGCVPRPHGVALDFGCGAGQLTQAIAKRFTTCFGVDFSAEIIRKARELNRCPNCNYMVSARQRLSFAEGSMTFVYSGLTLQQMERELALGYVREFLRVVRPGGVAVFGMKDPVKDGAPVAKVRDVLGLAARMRQAMAMRESEMQVNHLVQDDVRDAVWPARVVDVRLTNTAAKDFDGRLAYLSVAPEAEFVGKQYCVVKRV